VICAIEAKCRIKEIPNVTKSLLNAENIIFFYFAQI
jgi:hypothetical protein